VDKKEYWENIYQSKDSSNVSWYAPHLANSVQIIETISASLDANIIDVGGGASTLVDDLLDRGYRSISVLDLSQKALLVAKQRLGKRAATVTWIVGDATRTVLPPAAYNLWHDRAVFHFLTDPADRLLYVENVLRAVRPGGHVIIATFGPKGPERCSGLDIVRYDSEGLHREFGSAFVKLGSLLEQHVTPWGTEQEFIYCYCLKVR
jgi:SAM-dependent methyltransferase